MQKKTVLFENLKKQTDLYNGEHGSQENISLQSRLISNGERNDR